ncbi:MAG: YicC/YloC family endoribonuclease [Planctomycetota bacterium]
MTGAGVARGASEVGDVAVELRSINGRTLAIKTRLPPECQGLERSIEQRLRASLQRGTVTVLVERTGDRDTEVLVDRGAAESAVTQLRALATELGLADDLAASHLLSVPGVLRGGGAPPGPRASWDLPAELGRLVDAALAQLVDERRREGAATAAAIAGELDALAAAAQDAAARVPLIAEAYRARLIARVNEFLEGQARAVNDADVVREVAIYAERADVGEELQRLGEHLTGARGILAGGGAVGRSLEFLCQELLREVNTLGSKAQDADMARLVVMMKTSVERLREQAANVE